MRHAMCSMCLLFICAAMVAAAPWAGPAEGAGPGSQDKDFSDATAYPVVRIERSGSVVVKIKGEETRLWLVGVESPSPDGPGSRTGSPDLREFLEGILGGENVFIEFSSSEAKKDRFGRYGAYIYRAPEGLPINLEIVRQGVAPLDKRFRSRYRAVYERYAATARKAGKGVWGRRRPRAPRSAEKDEADNPTRAANAPRARDEKVQLYMTKYGKRYHRASCETLTKTKRKVTLAEAEKDGRTPCLVCKPPK